MRRVVAVLLAFALASSPALAQSDHNAAPQKAEQPQAVAPDKKPEGASPSASEASNSSSDREKHKEQCEYQGPSWFAGVYCFFALHDKFWVSFGTLILAIGTTVLGFATIFLWRATRDLVRDARATGAEQLKISIKAAEAATLSADAVIESERARMFPFIAKENFIQLLRIIAADKGLEDYRVMHPRGSWMWNANEQMTYCFRNYGRTPAVIQEIGHGSAISDDLPSEREYSLLVPLPVRPMIAGRENCEQITFDCFPDLIVEDARSIANIAGKTFWFYGYIVYDDMFGWQRTQRFVWHYSAISNGFSLYDYRETERRREDSGSVS